MRALVPMCVALVAGCSCGGGHPVPDGGDREAGQDAGRDTGVDASRDAEVDAPADAEADGSGPGHCEEDEEPVEVTRVDADPPAEDCGAGCVRVTSAPSSVDDYDVFDSVLVFGEPNVKGRQSVLGWVDLARGEELHVSTPTGSLLESTVASDGRLTYYSTFETETGIGRLWQMDIARQCRRQLREFHRQDETYADLPEDPDVDGDWLVWWDERWGSGRQDVFAYDLPAGMEVQLTNDQCCVANTRISGTTVVYTGWASTPYWIRALDVVSGGAHVLWEGPGEQDNAAIDGTRVVFQSEVSLGAANTDIVAVDVESGERTTVCDQEAPQHYPDVFGDLVVWEDCRNAPEPARCRDNVDIYGKDLLTGTEVAITTGPGYEVRPRVWGETVYFRSVASDQSIQVFAIPFPR